MFERLFAQRGLSLERLKSFLEVVQSGSIAKAAARDPSKQSLISRQIRELEAYFGTPLTARKGRGLRITAKGQNLAHLTREFFLQVEDFRQAAQKQRANFRLGAGSSTIQWILIPKLRELSETLRSDFDLSRIQNQQASRLLDQGEIDLAIVRSDAISKDNPKLDWLPLGSCAYRLFQSRECPDAPMAILSGDGQLATIQRQHAPSEAPLIRCDSSLQIAALIGAGQARGILPFMARHEFRQMPWIEELEPPSLQMYQRHFCLAWNQHRIQTYSLTQTHMSTCAQLLSLP